MVGCSSNLPWRGAGGSSRYCVTAPFSTEVPPRRAPLEWVAEVCVDCWGWRIGGWGAGWGGPEMLSSDRDGWCEAPQASKDRGDNQPALWPPTSSTRRPEVALWLAGSWEEVKMKLLQGGTREMEGEEEEEVGEEGSGHFCWWSRVWFLDTGAFCHHITASSSERLNNSSPEIQRLKSRATRRNTHTCRFLQVADG